MFDPDDFSDDFELPAEEPAPEGDSEDGPWISHGVLHLARPPINH